MFYDLVLLQEKKRMRGDIIERCLIFLLKLPEMRVPDHFHSTVLSILEWGDETLVSLVCLLLEKFKVSHTPVQAMALLVELVKWLNSNLSQRVCRLPTSAWSVYSRVVESAPSQSYFILISLYIIMCLWQGFIQAGDCSVSRGRAGAGCGSGWGGVHGGAHTGPAGKARHFRTQGESSSFSLIG